MPGLTFLQLQLAPMDVKIKIAWLLIAIPLFLIFPYLSLMIQSLVSKTAYNYKPYQPAAQLLFIGLIRVRILWPTILMQIRWMDMLLMQLTPQMGAEIQLPWRYGKAQRFPMYR